MNKILIIEDDAQIRDNIQQILDLEGFSTITAEDGWHGLQMAEQYRPDMIICDLMMPHLDGYGLIKALRQKPVTAAIPFIFITAKSEHSDLRRAMELGADDYLTKPFQVNELLQVIATRLEKHQIVRQYYRDQIEEMESQLNYLARHDSLTGLPNQLFLEEHFNQIRLQAYSQGQQLSLLLIDIDILYRNKLFLEPSLRYLLLKAVAERLTGLNSSEQVIDLIAYLKTDQIVILLKSSEDSKIASDIAQKILDNLSEPIVVNQQQISVKTQIGIVCYPNDGLQLGELLTHAELALEHFKNEDTVAYHFYNQEIFNILFRKIILETDLWQALERNEFQLYYQPQFNAKSGKFVCVEALIRWKHPEYGLVSPGEFIPIAEESGFIIPLGKWILKTACSQLQDLKLQGLVNVDLAVNISANQFRQQNFVQQIHEVIAETNFPPEQLKLELTETVFIQDMEAVNKKINALKNYGIQFSIDDFGTGYSSFKYIQGLSFNQVKIDRYFINNIDKLVQKQSIVKSIIQMAHNLNINIIAEGVETNNELSWLMQNNCHIIQGYFFSRPLPIEDLKTLLLAKR
ncbi:MAG: hypothetical protein RLZZ507_162 [Cyanobacteriota bacterium]|jgi:diguanylate cyclase (GGDEF)-like protein